LPETIAVQGRSRDADDDGEPTRNGR
jgi:hypothetical protein